MLGATVGDSHIVRIYHLNIQRVQFNLNNARVTFGCSLIAILQQNGADL